MLKDLTISEFLEEAASARPTPGGGSAVALAAAAGAALSVMVGNLTINNEKYLKESASALVLQNKLRPLLEKLTGYIDADANAFASVIAAYKLPKETTSEKQARSDAVEAALQAAAELPLQVASNALQVLFLSGEMLKIGNRHAASDAAVAGRLSYAAIWGAIYSIRINLSLIKNEAFVLTSRAQIAAIIEKSELLLTELAKNADEITVL